MVCNLMIQPFLTQSVLYWVPIKGYFLNDCAYSSLLPAFELQVYCSRYWESLLLRHCAYKSAVLILNITVKL